MVITAFLLVALIKAMACAHIAPPDQFKAATISLARYMKSLTLSAEIVKYKERLKLY